MGSANIKGGFQGQLKLKLKGKAPRLTTLLVNETETSRVGVFSFFSKFNIYTEFFSFEEQQILLSQKPRIFH